MPIRPVFFVFAVLAAATSAACVLFDHDRDRWSGGYTPPPDRGPSRPRDAGGPAHQPVFGETVTAEDPPPALSGGTLLVTRDRAYAVAADPDRDVVYAVHLATSAVSAFALEPHDEPGRLVEDDHGRVHVALRGGGAVAVVDRESGVVGRRGACAEPRGLDFDAAHRRVLVACSGGELVATSVDDLAAPAGVVARLDRDLRDVVVTGSRVLVSRFRSAEVLELDATLSVLGRLRERTRPGAEPMVAFRMVADDDGAPLVVGEKASSSAVPTSPGTYYGPPPSDDYDRPCSGGGGILFSSVGRVGGGFMRLPSAAVLPLDLARDGARLAVVAAGNGHTPSLPQLIVVEPSSRDWTECGYAVESHFTPGQITSVAVLASRRYVVLSREPAALTIVPDGPTIPLSSVSREDTGHAVFHANSSRGVACASCHPEGGDDGRTWLFTDGELRRTQSLRGTLAGTAPYHWGGEIDDIAHVSKEQMSGRMGGPELDDRQNAALERWLFAIPAPRASAPSDEAAVARGRALFERRDFGCAGCHSGARFTSNVSVDVGTGRPFQVPSLLGVGARAPYMHDGCAATLRERFGSCGGDRHGLPDAVTAAELDDLVAYLETL